MLEARFNQVSAQLPFIQGCTAFSGKRCIASGDLRTVVAKAKHELQANEQAAILIFDDKTGELVEVDFRGELEAVLGRIGSNPTETASDEGLQPGAGGGRGPGRPKLGVIAREVTLLPRHWEWLANQPGGASVALRKLVETARRTNQDQDRIRQAREVCYNFMVSMAGDETGFEEATRALFAGNCGRFEEMTQSWPPDIGAHARALARLAFPETV